MPYAPGDALLLERGREELKSLAPYMRVAMANSRSSESNVFVGSVQ